MKRIAIVSAAALFLLQPAPGAYAKPQQTRPRVPVLTNEDLLSPGASTAPRPEEPFPALTPRRGTLQNSLAVLQRMLGKMAEVKSVRTRIQASLPTGERDVLIETIKPDRTRVVSPEGEMIAIGGKFYLKANGGWQVTNIPAGNVARDTGFDFSAVVTQMIDKSRVSITGHILGDHVLDGVDCSAYEFEVTDRSETGTIQVSVGKKDGYMRRLSIANGSGLTINVGFTDINQPISIQPPM